MSNQVKKIAHLAKQLFKTPPSQSNREVEQREVEKVEMPKEGGTFMHLKGYDQPYPGVPMQQIVDNLEKVKRMVPLALDYFYPLLQKYNLKPERLSHPVREVYRVFSILIERESGERLEEMWTKFRDMLCLLLEYDNAYRFRFQEMMEEIDIDKIKLDKIDKYWISQRDDGYDWQCDKSKHKKDESSKTK